MGSISFPSIKVAKLPSGGSLGSGTLSEDLGSVPYSSSSLSEYPSPSS